MQCNKTETDPFFTCKKKVDGDGAWEKIAKMKREGTYTLPFHLPILSSSFYFIAIIFFIQQAEL